MILTLENKKKDIHPLFLTFSLPLQGMDAKIRSEAKTSSSPMLTMLTLRFPASPPTSRGRQAGANRPAAHLSSGSACYKRCEDGSRRRPSHVIRTSCASQQQAPPL